VKRLHTEACPVCGAPAKTLEDVAPEEKTRFSQQCLNDRYRVTKFIAQGGMGSVFKGYDSFHHRMVAIKFLWSDGPLLQHGAYRRFLREARILAQLKSPHAVVFLDFARAAGPEPFIVMELLNGRPLSAELAADGPLVPAHAALRMAHVCEVLAELHQLGFLHRDLKPSNIFVNDSWDGSVQIKVLDFGIARYLERPPGESWTTGGVTLGTPAYMSPEQVAGRELTAASDLYAVGVVLYEMITGRCPFAGGATEVAQHHMATPAPQLPMSAAIPGDLAQLVADLLQKKPSKRPSSAAEVRARLLATLGTR